ncbi:uncharacterized protein LOC116082752 isoform X1 [Mastomys coucha]|uniref:uncharacterized protein LOC116082752 isoform X1 n=1 Tax=Mastomys coucha TaxID=35658 RepID=UPI0012625BEF|nr:uncharacterized protein LOC116082752 isoform X1 [Mastomys coucha]XP_031215531.1 uncharacterized protein LOC116082752 isoform X1 [Mastomys coucha]
MFDSALKNAKGVLHSTKIPSLCKSKQAHPSGQYANLFSSLINGNCMCTEELKRKSLVFDLCTYFTCLYNTWFRLKLSREEESQVEKLKQPWPVTHNSAPDYVTRSSCHPGVLKRMLSHLDSRHWIWRKRKCLRFPLVRSHKEQKTKVLAGLLLKTVLRSECTSTLVLYLTATALTCWPPQAPGMKRPRSGKGYITCRLSQLVGWKRNSLLSDCSLSDASSLLDILGLCPK